MQNRSARYICWFFSFFVQYGQADAQSQSANVQLQMDDVELSVFVDLIAEATGKNYIIDPTVNGKVSVIAPNLLSADEAESVFRNILEINHLSVVEGEGADRIVPAGRVKQMTSGRGGGKFVTKLIAVDSGSVVDVMHVIQPLLSQAAVLTPIEASGLLVVSDQESRLGGIEAIVDRLNDFRTSEVETVAVANGRANDLVEVIRELDIIPAGARVAADLNTNSVLVSGPEHFKKRIRALVSQLDTAKRQNASRVLQLRYADASEIADIVRQNYQSQSDEKPVSIVADPRSNSLLITAAFDDLDAIEAAVRQLDTKLKQVLIEAVIFELAVDDFSDLTVQFGGVLQGALAGGIQFSLGERPPLTALVASVFSSTGVNPGSGLSIGSAMEKTNGNGIVGFLSALARETNTNILSTPSILTLDNEEAEIIVAQNIPFVTGSYSTVGDSAVPQTPFQTIKRQDVGLSLKVKPQISADRSVRLAVVQEVSNLTNSASAAGEITAKRSISTNVIIDDGQIVVLGGLIDNSSAKSRQSVPGLSEVPLLGNLFRSDETKENRRVLLVMLRPQVILDGEDLARVSASGALRAQNESASFQSTAYRNLASTSRKSQGFLGDYFDGGFEDRFAAENNYPQLPPRITLR